MSRLVSVLLTRESPSVLSRVSARESAEHDVLYVLCIISLHFTNYLECFEIVFTMYDLLEKTFILICLFNSPILSLRLIS